ncbi:MAG: hypothetical protein IT579_21995 [Verrucomicrobia subdivision 3 bacterium]|nr:hypothetical protein [Limisphaerales bacterium]
MKVRKNPRRLQHRNPPTPRLGCIPGIATAAGSLDWRAMEIPEDWRLLERSVERPSNPRTQFECPERELASRRLQFAATAMARLRGAMPGIPRQSNCMAKLALEFAGRPEYPKATVNAVCAMVRDMKCHQTPAIV